MTINMLRNMVGVEQLSKGSGGDVFANTEIADNMGVVRYVGPDVDVKGIKLGVKVFYGDERALIRMGGQDVIVMQDSNIIALVAE